MSEIIDSIKEAIKKRMVTPVYGTFITFWAIFHWRALYSTFFMSEDYIFKATGLLRDQYIANLFWNSEKIFTSLLNWIAPLILTWVTIWFAPKYILIPAFKKEEEYRIEKIKTRLESQEKITQEETKLTKKETEKLKAVERKITKEEQIKSKDPRTMWNEEYEKFKGTNNFNSFYLIIESLYKHGGRVEWYTPGSSYGTSVPRDLLAYAHSNELIELDVDKNNNTVIKLTEKGKFFIAKINEH